MSGYRALSNRKLIVPLQIDRATVEDRTAGPISEPWSTDVEYATTVASPPSAGPHEPRCAVALSAAGATRMAGSRGPAASTPWVNSGRLEAFLVGRVCSPSCDGGG